MSGESVIGVIPNAKIKMGMFKTKRYTLVFTSYRLLLAEARDDLVKAEVERARAAAKAQGSGFFGQWGAQLKVKFGPHYLAAPPDSILAETPGNGALTPADVRSLRIEKKQKDDGDDSMIPYLRVTIEATTGKFEFETDDEEPRVDDARRMAASVFGPVVR